MDCWKKKEGLGESINKQTRIGFKSVVAQVSTTILDSLFVTYHNPQFSCVDLIYSSMSNEESLPAFTLFGLDDVENYGLVSGL